MQRPYAQAVEVLHPEVVVVQDDVLVVLVVALLRQAFAAAAVYFLDDNGSGPGMEQFQRQGGPSQAQADLVRSEFEASLNKVKVGKGDVMIFPGGMPGTKNLAADKELMGLMKNQYVLGCTVAAICAAPGLVASQLNPLYGKRFTCFEGFQEPMLRKGAVFTGESAVVDDRLITGRGAGHAVNFGLAILRHLKGAEVADKVKEGLML